MIIHSVARRPTLTYYFRWLLVVSALQLVVSAGHVGALLARTIIAFVFMDDAAREAYLADERTPLHTAEQGLYTVNVSHLCTLPRHLHS